VVYRDLDATLTDSRVEAVHQKLLNTVQSRFTATLRGQ
jgi:phenylalanyl-tRNA synthetase beta subunit